MVMPGVITPAKKTSHLEALPGAVKPTGFPSGLAVKRFPEWQSLSFRPTDLATDLLLSVLLKVIKKLKLVSHGLFVESYI